MPLLAVIDRDATAVALPGLGTARPAGFTGTKDAYAEWLGEMLGRVDEPVDVVGHDLGALHLADLCVGRRAGAGPDGRVRLRA